MSKVRKVVNWHEYNKTLQSRGEIVFHITAEYYNKLHYKGKQKKGGIRKYNPEMFELISSVQMIFQLPIRATIGFTKQLLYKLHNEEVEVPNFGHASRMLSKLKFKVKRYTEASTNIVLSFDGTGLKIHSLFGWHERKHARQKKLDANEKWKKLHLGVDLKTGQILSCKLTDSGCNDCEVAEPIINELKDLNIDIIIGDGAYDTYRIYEIASQIGAKLVVPPKVGSKSQDELKGYHKPVDYLKARDEVINFIRKFEDFKAGRKKWKKESGYHQRSIIEAAIFRFKRICGCNLRNKNDISRLNEVTTKVNILNNMFNLGKAKYMT